MIPISIAGTGHSLPATVVPSSELDRRLGLEPGTLEASTGVHSRHVCVEEDQISLATSAAGRAIAAAGMTAGEIDLVLGGCAIPYQTLPTTAPLVMRRLGIADGDAAAFDVNASCLGFLTAIEVAACRIAAGECRAALVFAADIASRALPWQSQPEVAALFGDGAAAAVLTPAAWIGSGIHASLHACYPSAYEACQIGAGGTRFDFHHDFDNFASHTLFHMDGRALFRVTHLHFPDFVDRLLDKAGWQRADVDLVVPHQASPLALQHMIQRTGIDAERVVNIAPRFGNQIAASLPTALDIAWREGRIRQGMRLLLLGTSAGVCFGGVAIEVGQ